MNANFHWAKNGIEAIDHVKQNTYDIILMDLKLPVLNGIEATKAIHKLKPNQVIIAQTALNKKETEKRYPECSFDDYIIKPVLINDLIKVLEDKLS